MLRASTALIAVPASQPGVSLFLAQIVEGNLRPHRPHRPRSSISAG
jgi:hypothetical protein